MKRVLTSVTIVALSMGWGGLSAHAASFGFNGHVNHRFERLSDFPVDAEGTLHGQPYRHLMRARFGAQMSFSRLFWIRSTLQLLDGQVLGSESPVHNGSRGEQWANMPLTQHLQLRESTLQIPIGLGVVRMGRMPIRWGMGLVVHDGETVDSPFDDPRGGDIVNGAWVDLKPLLPFVQNRLAYGLHLGLGGDVVEQDELTSRPDGDLAWRIAGSLTWEEPWLDGGLYVMMRQLERPNDERAEHIVIDTAWRLRTRFGERYRLVAEVEAALVTGSITPPDQSNATQIEQYGAAARVSLQDEAASATYALEIGIASGDGDPNDTRDTAFRFDPARRVGMVLFDEVLSRLSARDVTRWADANDAEVRGWAPTDGAVVGSLYVAPRIGFVLCDGCVVLEVGGVIAFAPSPLRSSVDTDGGDAAQGPLGSPATAGAIGYEFNAGATLALDIESVVSLSLGTQYGVFVPGDALAAASPEHALGVVHKWRLLANVTW